MKHIICLSLLVFSSTLLTAQPAVFDRGIVNAASLAKIALPNSSIAQGSFFSVFGTNIGPAKSPSLAFPLQTNLGGVSLTIGTAGQTFNALPLFVGPNQINAVLPSNVPVGPATLTVSFNGTSNSIDFQVVAHSFGIFTVPQSGAGPGVIDDSNYSLFTLTHSAVAGDIAIIWGTGLTAVDASKEAAQPLPGDHQEVPVEVYVGLQKANVTYRGRSGCCVGVDQIFFTVPTGVTGCHVPVAVKIGDIVSNFPTMPIAASASSRVCTDPAGPSAADLSQYQKQGTFSGGFIGLDRFTTSSPGLPPPLGTGKPTTTITETAIADFTKYLYQQLLAAQNPFSVTTVGACTLFAFGGRSPVNVDPITPTQLDAGSPLTVKGPNGTKQLPKSFGGLYFAQLGGGSPPNAQPLFLDSGAYTVTGPGGKDVGPFTANINIAPALTWTNEDSVNDITRSAGQLITWSGGDPSSIVIIEGGSIMAGTSADGSDTVGAFFFCTAPDSAQQFNIPALVLDSVPPSVNNPNIPIPTGSLSIASYQTASFTATGLDKGSISSTVSVGKNVNYK